MGGSSIKIVCLPFEKGYILKEKILLPVPLLVGKFFPLEKMISFQKETCVQKNKQKITKKNVSLVKHGENSTLYIRGLK